MRRSSQHESLSPQRPNPVALGIGLAILALHLVAVHQAMLAQPQNATEDQVKAAYLLNFAKLAEWPHSALPNGPSPLVIGVNGGEEDFLNILKATVAGKLIGTHLLAVRPVSSQAEMTSCHIVFFRASARKRTSAHIEGLPTAGVLSVGEDESFLGQGGMINLVRDQGSIRFEVNSDALDRSEIHFSAKILALAKSGDGSSHPTVANPPAEAARLVEHRVTPEYPEIAARMNLKGTAQVEALVRADGSVKEVRVLGGHPALADALVRAVRLWKFQPAPKETVEVVKVDFGPH